MGKGGRRPTGNPHVTYQKYSHRQKHKNPALHPPQPLLRPCGLQRVRHGHERGVQDMTALQGLTRVSFLPGPTTWCRTPLIRKRGSHLPTPDPVPNLPQPLVTFPWPCPGHGGATPVTLGHTGCPLSSPPTSLVCFGSHITCWLP